MSQCDHSLQFVASMIDRLIVVLSFALLVFMLGGASFYFGGEKSLPARHPGGSPGTHRGHPDLQAGEEARDFPVEGNDKNDIALPSLATQPAEKPAGADGLPERGTGRVDGDKAKNDCGAFPKRPGADSSRSEMCSYLSRAIEHSNACVNLRRKRDAEWQAGEKMKNIRILYTRIQNLKMEHALKCGSRRKITGFRVFLKGDPLIFQQKNIIQERDWDDF
ncbi:MAG: hypothetical protein LBF91_02025 [Azoarcus sp.]|nr:hypothetical protein [Azoarcus sp.]